MGLTLQLTNGEVTVAEMHRILMPGERLIFTIPTFKGLCFTNKLRCIVRHYHIYGTQEAPGSEALYPSVAPSCYRKEDSKYILLEQLTDPDPPGGIPGTVCPS
jgi:hypothetical protein